jgi:hypothetical protein
MNPWLPYTGVPDTIAVSVGDEVDCKLLATAAFATPVSWKIVS